MGWNNTAKIAINGVGPLALVGDWFFERNKLPHRLVEHCPRSAGGLPCNPATYCQPPTASPCEAALDSLCPVATDPGPEKCAKCEEKHTLKLVTAGCGGAYTQKSP